MNLVRKYRIWIPKAFLAWAYFMNGLFSLMLSPDFMDVVLGIGFPEIVAKVVLIVFGILYVSLAVYVIAAKKPHKHILILMGLWPLIMFILYRTLGMNIDIYFALVIFALAGFVYLYHYDSPESNKVID